MPNSRMHRHITSQALKVVPLEFEDKNNNSLIEDYCTWPDCYLDDPDKFRNYAFCKDNIVFHYLPDISFNELYRYWNIDCHGKYFSGKPFVNENFLHAKAGFTHYLGKITYCWLHCQYEEGKKYLGWLLHVLQDSVFGLHALEGPGGTDAFALNRLINSTPLAIEPLCNIPPIDFSFTEPYQPQILGDSVDEVFIKLYAKYYALTNNSRQCCFQLIMNEQNRSHDSDTKLWKQMFANVVKLSADVINSLIHLTSGKKSQRSFCSLTELEPHIFPFGGYGNYRFRSFERNVIYDKNQIIRELYLKSGNETICFERGISFGTHFGGGLKYWLPKGIFTIFRCVVGIFPEAKKDLPVKFDVVNNGKIIEQFELSFNQNCQKIQVDNPAEEFGFQIHATPNCGIILLGDPELYF